jgi:1-deoxy-D-xylulose-5-phosphate synthase
MVVRALDAANLLAANGIEAAVFDARFIKPLDKEAIVGLAKKCGSVVTVEENVLAGGFGSAVMEVLAEAGMSAIPILRLGIPDSFVEHGPREALLKSLGLDAEGIAGQVEKFQQLPKRL